MACLIRLWFPVILMLCILPACAHQAEDWRSDSAFHTPRVAQCLDLFEEMDAAVANAGAGDAQWARVPGFPYLRISRFLASFRDEVSGAAFEDWAARMRALDQRAREIEAANLPGAIRTALPLDQSTLQDCGDHVLDHDLKSERARVELRRAAHVPDHYADWQRVLGLYPLSAPFFAWGSFSWREDAAARFNRDNAGAGTLYTPEGQAPALGAVAAILRKAAENPLGIPDPKGAALEALFDRFAPVLAVDQQSPADFIGTMEWRGGKAHVDTDRPVAYRLLSHARVGNRVLLQLNYVFWFPERPSTGWFDLLAGHLDGLVWRVTLAPDGRPLIYDSIHPCGCYHMFFPVRPMQRTDKWSIWNEGAVEPGPGPEPAPGERVIIYLAARTHYITGLETTRDFGGARYGMRPYDDLRSLPLRDGARRSLFRPSGLVKGTGRGERFLFWPMGIASAGAMRQWGTHATAFVGKRHFDDPFLLVDSYDLPGRDGAP